MSVKVNMHKAKDALIRAMKANLVPMLQGSPGAGKSALIHQIAKEFNLKLIDLRLAQSDPTDLLGFPHPDKERGKAYYLPMSTFPVEGDPIPEGYNGWLLFLDEFNSADRNVQKAAYKLVLDRMVGERHLHSGVAIACAGNLESDNAIVEDLSTALQSRLIHLELEVDAEQWIDWATESGVDHRITSYVKYKPGNLFNFNPEHSDKTYPCPRTWEFASRLIVNENSLDGSLIPLLSGTVGEGTAREFISFSKIYKDLLSIEEIRANPNGVQVPEEPSVLYALTGAIAQNAANHNVADLMKFTTRLPVEFQVVTLREMVRRSKELLQHSAVQAWVSRNATELF